ncbi:hypothetical protein X943_000956 [Babesia divergens]|uniref:Peroxisome assembly protein 22 n=1 Tax=Babesia divergens TaxID=32595 RepID=A0AAD9G6M9_BABDI|nr:hypothetical protein X943_000956 [Babesia divergens]
MHSNSKGAKVIKAAYNAGQNTDAGAVTLTLFIGFISGFIFLYVLYLRTLKRLSASRESHENSEKERKDTRASVSIFINDLLFSHGTLKIIQGNIGPLVEIAAKCNLYLFVQVDDENNIATILDGLEQCDAFKAGLKKHRVLFSSTSTGRASMVRQLQPTLHMESNQDVVNAIHDKVANLLMFKVTQSEESGDSNQYNENEDDIVNVKTAADIITILQPLITTS